ncbi:DMT family transporter [Acidipropionibacterium virtanenii]|uniref:Quaternary ammonium compound-resistance protein SugE n=1 Tax=Acidipropionibacterium virtanenii TaxID=2057246 RepID=A0A344UYD3_9ACTN|nr:multidrug efflux SMR transporter [Acidipropionibacterium virtanenii]AXE40281.1 Quaternary ammonium compound-resistance protein SugE [Acidipropionibacterium virtanenii]
MAWIVLIVSGSFEAVWATALDRAQGFTRPIPSIIFLLAMVLSVTGLGYAMKSLPTGTAYAVWTAVGAALTVLYAMITGTEPFSVARVLLLAGIIGCVIGLKALS